MVTSTDDGARRSDRARVPREVTFRGVDEQLLRVALSSTDRVAPEWAELRARFDPHELDDPRVVQLLPLVGDALVRAGVHDHELSRMRGVRRHTFFTHQMLVADLVAALDVLEAAGIRNLLLKGIPLALLHFPDPSLRPMVDIDMLVDVAALPRAIALLDDAGWRCRSPRPPDLVRRLTELLYRAPDDRADLDLHWRLVPWVGHGGGGADPGIWSAAQPISVQGRTALAPSPDDLLLHLVLHAYRSGWRQVPRWVADAAMLLRSTGTTFDWERFVVRVEQGKLVPPVRDALGYAATIAALPIPADVLDRLRATTVDRGTERRYETGNRPLTGRRHRIAGQLDDLRVGWCRRTFNLERGARARALTPFVLARTGADHLWSLPFVVAGHRRARHA